MKVTNRSCCVTRHISSFEIPTTSKRAGLVSGVFSWKHGMELKGTIRKLQHNSLLSWGKCIALISVICKVSTLHIDMKVIV